MRYKQLKDDYIDIKDNEFLKMVETLKEDHIIVLNDGKHIILSKKLLERWIKDKVVIE